MGLGIGEIWSLQDGTKDEVWGLVAGEGSIDGVGWGIRRVVLRG